MNRPRKAIIGDTQTISIDFGKPNPGEVYNVRVLIEKPDGVIEARYLSYKFYEEVKR